MRGEDRKFMLYEWARPVHLGPVAGADEAEVIDQKLLQRVEVEAQVAGAGVHHEGTGVPDSVPANSTPPSL